MIYSLKVLLAESIDYAGLFPPSELEMSTAVRNYAHYISGEHAWMLGRFIVPATRLTEFEQAAKEFLPRDVAADSWKLSVLVGSDLDKELKSILRFNELHRHPAKAGGASIDAIELKISLPEDVRRATETITRITNAEAFAIYFETPVAAGFSELIGHIARAGGRAKVRTGGITAAMVPPTANLLGFIDVCAKANVPFKATAGLHHPLRAVHPLTYEQNSPSALMHGFLNVFLAASFVLSGMNMDIAAELLEEHDRLAFHFDANKVVWRGHQLSSDELREARANFACSFGSCSFEEPFEELKTLTLL